MPAETKMFGHITRWEPEADPGDRLMRTHLVVGAQPLYIRLSQVELLAEFRDAVSPIAASTLRGFDLFPSASAETADEPPGRGIYPQTIPYDGGVGGAAADPRSRA